MEAEGVLLGPGVFEGSSNFQRNKYEKFNTNLHTTDAQSKTLPPPFKPLSIPTRPRTMSKSSQTSKQSWDRVSDMESILEKEERPELFSRSHISQDTFLDGKYYSGDKGATAPSEQKLDGIIKTYEDSQK